MTILGIAGDMGSGKDTVKEYLTDRYGAKSFGFSTVLRDILERLSLDVSRANYATLAETLRETFGEDILSRSLSRDISRVSVPLIVVEGARKPGEFVLFQKMTDFRLLFIETDLRVRYERIVRRGSKSDDQEKTFEAFVKDHDHPADREVGKIRERADFVVANDGTLDDLYAKIDAVVAVLPGGEALAKTSTLGVKSK